MEELLYAPEGMYTVLSSWFYYGAIENSLTNLVYLSRDFNALVAQDSNLVALMQALCLFTPDRPALDARQAVSHQSNEPFILTGLL